MVKNYFRSNPRWRTGELLRMVKSLFLNNSAADCPILLKFRMWVISRASGSGHSYLVIKYVENNWRNGRLQVTM